MTTVYLANYSTIGEVEAEQDDPTLSDCCNDKEALELLAVPRAAGIGQSLVVVLAELFKMVEGDLLDACDQDDPKPDFRWVSGKWRKPTTKNGRPNLTHKLFDGKELVGMVIVQKVEV